MNFKHREHIVWNVELKEESRSSKKKFLNKFFQEATYKESLDTKWTGLCPRIVHAMD